LAAEVRRVIVGQPGFDEGENVVDEIVLGVGNKGSARDVIRVAAEIIEETQGVPRHVVCTTPKVSIVSEREGYEDEFESYTLRLSLPEPARNAVENAAAAHSGACAISKEKDSITLQCPPEGSTDFDAGREAIDEISHAFKIPEVWRVVGDRFRIDPISVELIFQAMVQYKASDCHLCPGKPPIFRIDNQARESELMGSLSAAQLVALIEEIASVPDWKRFNEFMQCSFSFHQVGLGYSRVSCFFKGGAPHVTFRFLPETIPSFEELKVPVETMQDLANLHRGLLLITGMTGSGKTTTLAALVDWINQHKHLHILSIENPIEFVHQNKKAVVSQRRLGIDVVSFNEGVRGALRHDPDVIVIGEMRDKDTIRSAIDAAATGHLVLSTLHANSASEVVNRIVSFFDPIERDLVKLQLRDSLRCCINQRLLPKKGGGRIPALEIMFNDIKPISDAIIAGDTDNIRIGMQQTMSHSILFEQYLHKMYKNGEIELEHAREFSTEESMFDQLNMETYSVPRLESIKAAGE
jgi:twitching motility protein PilT